MEEINCNKIVAGIINAFLLYDSKDMKANREYLPHPHKRNFAYSPKLCKKEMS